MPIRRRHRDEKLEKIFDRARGLCHLCGKKLAFSNYGLRNKRASWHVDHSVPVALGGSDHGNNLKPACIRCNTDKGTVSSRTARKWNGMSRSPLNKTAFESAKTENTVTGGIAGATLGGMIGGPPGMLFGGLLGLIVGGTANPDDQMRA